MWNRVLGKGNEKADDSTSTSSRRRNDDDQRSQKRNRAESIVSSANTPNAPRSDERDRGFNPTSTSYSSSSRSPYPGAAPASIASSYATAASNVADQAIVPPDLVRNASLAEKMPKSQSSRDDYERGGDKASKSGRRRGRSTSRDRKSDRKERSRSRDRDEKKRDKKEKEKREKRSDKEDRKERGLSKSESVFSEYQGASRAGETGGAVEGSFSTQIGASGFTQFPGQYDAGMPGPSSGPPRPPKMSDHVPDQFPGQFPSGSTAPYRPPVALNEGGPGLASEYYGDAGESVAQQPGVRPQAPSLIVGAEPHLMAASPVAAPPPEPSVSGGVGAAASFFSGASFNSPSTSPKPAEKPPKPSSQTAYNGPSFGLVGSATLAGGAALAYGASSQDKVNYDQSSTNVTNNSYYTAPSQNTRPPGNTHHSSSAPILPTLGSAVAGAAAGYAFGSHTLSHHEQPISPAVTGSNQGESRPPASQAGLSQSTSYHESYTENNRPPRPGESSHHSSNIPLYAAGAAGAAGLAAAAYHHNNQSSSQHTNNGQDYATAPMAHRHKHHGPLDKFVDFFRDPEGVAQFEEYSEIIGVCRYCFAPGSSPRDAPRKHTYRKKRSIERLGSSIRVDKDSRYHSDGEKRRKNGSSWLATGIAGYGLAQVGKTLFGDNRDFDDTYSVKSGRANYSNTTLHSGRDGRSPDRDSHISYGVTGTVSHPHSSRRSRSRERVEAGITRDGKLYRKESHAGAHGGPTITTSNIKRRSRSRSRDRKSGLAEAAIGAAIGGSVIASATRKRSKSPKKSKHRSRSHSRERRSVAYVKDSDDRKSHRKSRHSPQSSYVEIRRQSPKRETGIFGDFFNAPPKTEKKKNRSGHKKKQKTGFFNFGNSSSSSSDSAIAFGAGSDRSKGKKVSKPRIRDDRDAQNAVLGLSAAAAALAVAEGKRSDKGKRRADVVAVKDVKTKQTTSHPKHDERREHSRHREEDGWESMTEPDGYSSVDSTLAYGVERRGSSSSLRSDASGTGKWGWRWGSKKEKRRHSPKSTDHFPYAATAAVAGVAGAALASRDHHVDSVASSSINLPPLQHLPPMPIHDSPQHEYSRNAVTAPHDPLVTSRPAPIPLQQPQPIAPISSSVYTSQAPPYHSYSAPAGPTIFSQRTQPSYPTDRSHDGNYSSITPFDMPGGFPDSYGPPPSALREAPSEKHSRRRDSSPTPKIVEIQPGSQRRSSTRDESSSVRFDFTKEQEEKDRRRARVREQEHQEKILRREAEEQEELERERQRAQRRAEKSAEEQARHYAGKDREIERLISEAETAPKQESYLSWTAPVVTGVAGAAIGAVAAKERSSSSEERRAKRKEEKRRRTRDSESREIEKTKESPSPEDKEDVVRAQREAAIVRRAADLVRRTPSPVHEKYASFFAPTEFLSKTSGENKARTVPDDDDDVASHIPQIVTIEPAEFRAESARYVYPATGPEYARDHDPTHMRAPWMYPPSLRLVKPTPPSSAAPSTTGSVKGDASPVIEPVDDKAKEKAEDITSRVKVTFGEAETREYEVMTPEDHHDEFIRPTPRMEEVRIAAEDDGSPVEEIAREHMPGEFGDDLDFAATLAAGLQESGFDPNIVIEDTSFRRRTSPPGSDDERPFQPTVVEVVDESWEPSGVPLQHGFVEEGELPPTPKDGMKSAAVRDLKKENSEIEMNGKHVEVKEKRDRSETVDDILVPLSITPLGKVRENYVGPASGYTQEPEVIEAVPRSLPDELDDDLKEDKKKREKKSKRDSARSEILKSRSPFEPMPSKDEYFDAAEVPQGPVESVREPKSTARETPIAEDDADDYVSLSKKDKKGKRSKHGRDFYESPEEDDSVSVAATVPLKDDYKESKQSKKKSKRRTADFDDSASIASSPARFDGEKETNGGGKKDKKGGFFGIFSKSTEELSEPKSTKEKDIAFDGFEEPKKKGKKSKSRRSARDTDEFESPRSGSVPDLDDAEAEGEKDMSSQRNGKSRSRKDSKAGEESGRVTQELPTKVYPPSSLGRHSVSRVSTLLTTIKVRDQTENEARRSARSIDDDDPGEKPVRTKEQDQPLSFLGMRQEITEPPDIDDPSPPSPRTLVLKEKAMYEEVSSKIAETAFSPRRAGRPISSAGLPQSSPSTPASVNQGTPLTSAHSRQPRPRSAEIKHVTEIRPLWLVEQHSSSRRRASAPEEPYPPLPASHSTSRASSVHGIDDEESLVDPEYAMLEKEALFDGKQETAARSDLLDSQQATPTAASFGVDRNVEPLLGDDTHIDESPSKDKVITAGVLAGGIAAVALGSIHQRRSSRARTTEEDIPQGTVLSRGLLDQHTEDAGELPIDDETTVGLDEAEEIVSPAAAEGLELQDDTDFVVKKNDKDKKKKGKKGKKSDRAPIEDIERSATSAPSSSMPSTPAEEAKIFSFDEQRKIEEQDAQDAVDSWFEPLTAKRDKKDKKKDRGAGISEVMSQARSLDSAGSKKDKDIQPVPPASSTVDGDDTPKSLAPLSSAETKDKDFELSKGMSESAVVGMMAAAAITGAAIGAVVVEDAAAAGSTAIKDEAAATKEVEDDNWQSFGNNSKKGKKGKAKKRVAIPLSEEVTGANSATLPGAKEITSKELVAGTDVPTDITFIPETVPLPLETANEIAELDDTPPKERDEDLFPITKKGKKDKKSKSKKKTVLFDDEPAENMEASQVLSIPAVETTESAAMDLQASEEAQPSKKSKKGKKGKKYAAFDDFEDKPESLDEQSRGFEDMGGRSSLSDAAIAEAVNREIHSLLGPPAESQEPALIVSGIAPAVATVEPEIKGPALSDAAIGRIVDREIHGSVDLAYGGHDGLITENRDQAMTISAQYEEKSSSLSDVAIHEAVEREIYGAGSSSEKQKPSLMLSRTKSTADAVEPNVEAPALSAVAISKTVDREVHESIDLVDSGQELVTAGYDIQPLAGPAQHQTTSSSLTDSAIHEAVEREINSHPKTPHDEDHLNTLVSARAQERNQDQLELQPPSREAATNQGVIQDIHTTSDTPIPRDSLEISGNKTAGLTFSPDDVALPMGDDTELLEPSPETPGLETVSTRGPTQQPMLSSTILLPDEHLAAQTTKEKRRSSDLTQIGLSGEPEYVAHNFPQPVEIAHPPIIPDRELHKPMSTLDNTPRFEEPTHTVEAVLDSDAADTPFTPAQEDHNDYFAFSSKRKAKKGKKGRRSQPETPRTELLPSHEEPAATRDDTMSQERSKQGDPQIATILKDGSDVRDFGVPLTKGVILPGDLNQPNLLESARGTDHQHDIADQPLTAGAATATTSTAEEVRKILETEKQISLASVLEPEGQRSPAEPVIQDMPEPDLPEDEWALPIKKKGKKGKKSKLSNIESEEVEPGKDEPKADLGSLVAFTDTAGEVDKPLANKDDAGSNVQPISKEVVGDDEFFSGFSKKKKGKKGKKSNRDTEDDNQDAEMAEVDLNLAAADSSRPQKVTDIEPFEDFSVPKSKEDKKSKRKALSRNISDFQEMPESEAASQDLGITEKSSIALPQSLSVDDIALEEAVRASLPAGLDDDFLEDSALISAQIPEPDIGEMPHEPLSKQHVLSSEQEWSQVDPVGYWEEAVKSPLPEDEANEFLELRSTAERDEAIKYPLLQDELGDFRGPERGLDNVETPAILDKETLESSDPALQDTERAVFDGDITGLEEAIKSPLPQDESEDFPEPKRGLNIVEKPIVRDTGSPEGSRPVLQDVETNEVETNYEDIFMPKKSKKDKKKGKRGKAYDWTKDPEDEYSAETSKEDPLVPSSELLIFEAAKSAPLPEESSTSADAETSSARAGTANSGPHPSGLEDVSDRETPGMEYSGSKAIASPEVAETIMDKEHEAKSGPLTTDGSLPVASTILPAVVPLILSHGEPKSSKFELEDVDTAPRDSRDEEPAIFSLKKSKKGKKKSKKGETLDWANETEVPASSTAPYAAKDIEPDTTIESAEVVEEESQPISDVAVGEDTEVFSSKRSKKDKKNAKNGQILDWTNEPEVTAASTSAEIPVDAAVEDVIPSAIEAERGTSSTKKSKKDKKKSKKGVALDWTEEPDITPSPTPTELPMEAAVDDVVSSVMEMEPETLNTKKSKKDKKKTKDGQFVPWDDEPEAAKTTVVFEPRESPAPSSSASEAIARDAPATSKVKPGETTPAASLETEEEEETHSLKKGKKDKKKAKKGHFLELGDDSEAVANSRPPGQAEPSASEVADISADSTPVLGTKSIIADEDGFSSKKSKKDKKKSKKGQSLDWHEEPDAVATTLPETIPEYTAGELVELPDEGAGVQNQVATSQALAGEGVTSYEEGKTDRKILKKGNIRAWDYVPEAITTTDASERIIDATSIALPESPFLEPTTSKELLDEDKGTALEHIQSQHTDRGIERSNPTDATTPPEGRGESLDMPEEMTSNLKGALDTSSKPNIPAEHAEEGLQHQGYREVAIQGSDFVPQEPKRVELPPEHEFRVQNQEYREVEHPQIEQDNSFFSFKTQKKNKKGKKSNARSIQDFTESGNVTPLLREAPLYDIVKEGSQGVVAQTQQDQVSQGLDMSRHDGNERFPERQDVSEFEPLIVPQPVHLTGEQRSDETTRSTSKIIDHLPEVQPADEDEFTGFVTKKKGKKGKKSSQANQSSFEPEILQTSLPSTETTRSIFSGAEVKETGTVEPPVFLSEKTLSTTEQSSPAPEDDWAEFGITKRKKSKRGKQQPLLAGDDDTRTAIPLEAEDSSYMKDASISHHVTGIAPLYETPVLEQAADRASGYESPSKPSMIHQVSPDTFNRSIPHEALVTHGSYETGPPRDKMEERIHHTGSGPLDEDMRTIQVSEADIYALPIDEPDPADDQQAVVVNRDIAKAAEASTEHRTEDALDSFMTEKGKKSKKSTGAAFLNEHSPTSVSGVSGPEERNVVIHSSDPAVQRGAGSIPHTQPEEQSRSREADEVEQPGIWDLHTTKKGKKSKKAKGFGNEEGVSPSFTPTSINGGKTLMPTITAVRDLVEGKPEQAQLQRQYPEETVSRSMDTRVDPNEETGKWDVPLTKKEKKSKKSKKQILDLPYESRLSKQATGSAPDTHAHHRDDTESYFTQDIARGEVGHAPTVEQLFKVSSDTHDITDIAHKAGHQRTGSLVGSKETVPGVGAGIALFESLQRADSLLESKKKDSESRGSRRNDQEDKKLEESPKEQDSVESTYLERDLNQSEDHYAYQPLEMQIQDDTTGPDFIAQGPGTVSPKIWPAEEILAPNRDSAVHVSDSPLGPEFQPARYSVRDSGYAGTEASPIFATDPESRERYLTHHDTKTSDSPLKQESDHEFDSYRDEKDRLIQNTQRSSIADSSENPLNMSIEVDPAYEVSILQPQQNQERARNVSHLVEELPASERALHQDAELPVHDYADRQPSPVDSTTRDRSSVLFQSSPSTREISDNTATDLHASSSPTMHLHQASDTGRNLYEISSPTKLPSHAKSPPLVSEKTSHGPPPSLFGGPVGINSDMRSPLSPPRTPLGMESSARHPLNTISEHSPEEHPVHKHPRQLSDVGSPERGIKSIRRSITPQAFAQHRVRSPLSNSPNDNGLASSDDIFARLSWPAVDEETHSVDLDRSKSRNTNSDRRSSSRHSSVPVLPIDFVRQHDTERRSVSGASVRSSESINAIIRAPEYQSPSTPPLRRVDRSMSGDLRAASKRDQAKKPTKLSETELEAEPVIASSSTYDPATDKGKNPIIKMTDVYVSNRHCALRLDLITDITILTAWLG